MIKTLLNIYQCNDDDDDDIHHQIDYETATVEQMLNSLSVNERDAFESLISNKEGLDILIQPWKPWWHTDDDHETNNEHVLDNNVNVKIHDNNSKDDYKPNTKPPFINSSNINPIILLGLLEIM
jgi:hypothetical protein